MDSIVVNRSGLVGIDGEVGPEAFLDAIEQRIGERFVAKNQFAAAIFWYEAALNQGGNPGGEWGIQSHPYRTWLPHKQLGLCYFQIGDPRRSLEHNRAAQRYLPDDEGVAANIAMLEDMLGQSRTVTGPLGA